MTSFEVLNTWLDPRLARRSPAPRWILSALAATSVALVLGISTGAQAPSKKGPGPQATEAREEPASGEVSAILATWKRLTTKVVATYFTRHPERAIARAFPGAKRIGLGTFGTGAALSWRETLTDTLSELGRLEGVGQSNAGQVGILTDWLSAELLLLDAQSLSTTDPSSHVQRAYVTLRAVQEASWIPPEERLSKLSTLLAELPAYLHDARISLSALAPQRIDQALHDLADLERLVGELERVTPSRPKPGSVSPEGGVKGFRNWLLEIRPGAGGTPPRLQGDEWTQLVGYVTGRTWSAHELKVNCLRELAELDLGSRKPPKRNRRILGATGLGLRGESASTYAVRAAKAADLLPERLKPQGVEFDTEVCLRTRPEIARLHPGPNSVRVLLQLPHPTWRASQTSARERGLETQSLAALGIRYGLAGEGLIARLSAKDRDALPMLLDGRLLREGFGLFTLEWMKHIEEGEDPFITREALTIETDFQIGLEAARFLASLELHSEGVSLEEAIMAFRRRTGLDEDTAMCDVLASERDPLFGIGYLGLLELRQLERDLAKLGGKKKSTRATIQLVMSHPGVRPADMLEWARHAPVQGGAR